MSPPTWRGRPGFLSSGHPTSSLIQSNEGAKGMLTDYPQFLPDARLDGLRDTYMGLGSFGQGMAVETLADEAGDLREHRPPPH